MDNYFSRTTRSPYASNLYPPPSTSSPYTHSAVPPYRPTTSSGYFHSPQPSPYAAHTQHHPQQPHHHGSPYRSQQEHGYPVAQPVNPQQHHNQSPYSSHHQQPHTQSPYSHHLPPQSHHSTQNLHPPHASPSPSPPTASGTNGARSPQPSTSPRPPSHHFAAANGSAAPAAAAAASPAPGGPTPSPQPPMSLDTMKNELNQLQHDIGVQESRLNFCSDSHDAKGAAEAAFRATEMKSRTKELQTEIKRRERRVEMELKIRTAMTQKFAAAEQAIMEHRKTMESLKQKLRAAFTVPMGSATTAIPAEPSPSTTGSNSPSASPAPLSSSTTSLFDLIPRFKQDAQRASLALERHVISVDGWKNEGVKSILTNVDLSSSIAPSNPSSSSPPPPSSSSSSDNHSDEELVRELVEILNPVFKESCKEATRAALGVQDEIDKLCKHIVNTQQFLGYLAPPQATTSPPATGIDSTTAEQL